MSTCQSQHSRLELDVPVLGKEILLLEHFSFCLLSYVLCLLTQPEGFSIFFKTTWETKRLKFRYRSSSISSEQLSYPVAEAGKNKENTLKHKQRWPVKAERESGVRGSEDVFWSDFEVVCLKGNWGDHLICRKATLWTNHHSQDGFWPAWGGM